MTTPKERLKAAQDELVRRGVRDIKFCWAPGASEKSTDEVAGAVADALEAYLVGDFEELDIATSDGNQK